MYISTCVYNCIGSTIANTYTPVTAPPSLPYNSSPLSPLPPPAGADVNRSTTANDHTVLSLACAGGHVSVVQYLLMQGGDPSYMLRVRRARGSQYCDHVSGGLETSDCWEQVSSMIGTFW
jgi:hypothetical protein